MLNTQVNDEELKKLLQSEELAKTVEFIRHNAMIGTDSLDPQTDLIVKSIALGWNAARATGDGSLESIVSRFKSEVKTMHPEAKVEINLKY